MPANHHRLATATTKPFLKSSVMWGTGVDLVEPCAHQWNACKPSLGHHLPTAACLSGVSNGAVLKISAPTFPAPLRNIHRKFNIVIRLWAR
jgi:hypothetical protein